MRNSITITLLPGNCITINGNDIQNDYCNKMLEEWLKEGKEIDLVISSKNISYVKTTLIRK